MNNHLTPRQMLAYIDGELSRTETRHAEKHLHSCWACLAELERLKSDIATILDAQNEALAPALPPPPQPWLGFDTILARKLPAEPIRSWQRFFACLQRSLTPTRSVLASAAVALFFVGFYAVVHTRTVSAKEVLRKVEVADTQRSRIAKNQVIRERIHVRRIPHGQKASRMVRVDTWKSPHAAYWQVEDSASAAADLQAQYQQHKIPADLPLSSASVESWGKAAGGGPTLSRQGIDMNLIFTGMKGSGEGSVERVSLLIQSEDWHIKQMTLDFPDASFEITEDDYTVMPMTDAPIAVLAYLEPPASPLALPATAGPVADTPAKSMVLPSVNLDMAELEVFTALHNARADLGDPVSVTRSSRAVHVGLWQLSPERQSELRAALISIPGVRVDTVRRQISVSTRTVISPTPVQAPTGIPLQVEGESGDEDKRLLQFFGNADRKQDFTNQALGTSTAILSHLYALHNLALQFPVSRDQQLSSEERERLQVLVRDHVTAVSVSLEDLKRQLDPLNANFNISACSSSPLSPVGSWQTGSQQALAASRAIDHLLRALLTTSQAPASPEYALPQINENIYHLRAELSTLTLPNLR
ncbi:MAG TPA: hypothetical protein VFE38_07675 [Edaphobacter sp.]|nr:hypothetical protein [Edaphobacter sp.]